MHEMLKNAYISPLPIARGYHQETFAQSEALRSMHMLVSETFQLTGSPTVIIVMSPPPIDGARLTCTVDQSSRSQAAH